MAEIPVSTVVNVSIATTPLAPSRAGFGTLLFVTTEAGVPFYEGVRFYASIDEIADDWATSSEVYKAAETYFSQAPKPTLLAIGTRFAAAQAGLLVGGGNAETTLATWTAITTGAFKISIDGEEEDITGLNFSAASDMDDVADVIETALQAVGTGTWSTATCVWDGVKFVITSGTTGTASTVSVTSAPTSGASIVALMDNDADNGTAFAGIAAETSIASALNRLNEASSDWYALAFIKTIRDNADAQAAAAWCEARVKQFFTTTNDATTLDSATSTDMAAVVNALEYRRTFVAYSSRPSQYPEVSAFARAATVNFDAENTTITLKFKQLPGITPETITSGQLSTLTSKGCNVYVTVGGVNILTEGIMAAGLGVFQDTVHGVDWLQNAIETNIFAYLVTRTTKAPLTDEGAAAVEAQVSRALVNAVRNGLVAPGYTFEGKYLQTGYETSVGAVADMSISDRQQRKCPPIQFTAIGAGAIHGVTVAGTFEA